VRALALLLVFVFGTAFAATPEDRLSAVFEAIEANKLDVALKRVDALIAEHPNFRLAHLVRGDLLLARGRPLQTFGNVVKTVPQERVDALRDEALARLRARQRPAEDRVPRYVLQLQPEQKHFLLVDSRRSRLYVYANQGGKAKLIADYYVTLGKNGIEKRREGDQKTSTIPTSGTAAKGATATASGCTACLRTCTAARRARATAASCSPTRTSIPCARTCRSASRR
jgi:hypothetical protein